MLIADDTTRNESEKRQSVSAAVAAAATKPTAACLTRSQSERSAARPEMSAADVSFVDTMRLSFCRRAKDDEANAAKTEDDDSRKRSSFELARRRLAAKVRKLCPPIL